MKLTDSVYLIGSGAVGISSPGDCNVYAVESRGEIALIDCGGAADPSALIRNLEMDGLKFSSVRSVLLTHAHTDHANAVAFFNNEGIEVYAAEMAKTMLADGMRKILSDKNIRFHPVNDFLCSMNHGRVDCVVKDGDVIPVEGLQLKVISTPGHSEDSVCYCFHTTDGDNLFSGDTVFYHGQISYFENGLSDREKYLESLRRLSALPVSGLFPGHVLFVVNGAKHHMEEAMSFVAKGQLPPQKCYS